ncbi:hypothetical protein FNP_0552 [Fusobacterium polymorphum ATCC 10953]|uniref:Uncharacterized protein n=1 Tax=Fusobacterium polymorphum ATCC 10953 TaxID=393480 RepID=A5TTY4_FUSNP|nr:hypothetical protein FNP_0552 [Fusobacterium polymorphum ATCC 10953]
MGIKVSPFFERLYSTLGGICGYSFLIIILSSSSSFNVLVKVLKEIFPILLFNSLYLIKGEFSYNLYMIIILYFPPINDKVYPKPVSSSFIFFSTQLLFSIYTLL